MDFSAQLAAARQAARQAAERIRAHYEAYLGVGETEGIGLEIKSDNTPVTIADKEAEALIRAQLGAQFPDYDFYGEETGRSGMDSEYLWLVDPLDGTRGFVRQYPFFSTQIALLYQDEIVLGVSHAPMFAEEAWALRGAGAWLNGKALAVSEIATLEAATVSTGNLSSLARSEAWQGLATLLAGAARTRGYGDFYHYHLLAAGKIELVIESDVNVLDIAALSLIVTEAGGRFTDLAGTPVSLTTGSVLAGVPALWQAAMDAL